MTSLRLFFLSAKHLLRLYLPNPWIRYAILLLAGALMIGAVVLGVVFGLHPPPAWERASRSPDAAVNLSAMFFILSIAIVAMPTLITVHGALKLLSHPESVSLVLLSPISPTAKFWSTIGPLILFSSIVYFIIISPFVVMFAFLEPLVSFITILYFFVVSGWSVVLSFLSLMLLVNYLGREKGLRLAYSLPFLLLLLPVLFLNVIEDFRAVAPVIGYWQLIFCSISLALLPPIFISTSQAFYKLLTTSLEPVRQYAEPHWGVYNPWDYLERQAVSWGLFSTLLFICLLVLDVLKFGIITQGMVAFSVFLFVTTPLSLVMQEEKNNPQRWAIAPYVYKVKQAIWVKLNLPLFLMGAAIIFYVGSEHLPWVASVLAILILGVLTLMWRPLQKVPAIQSVVFFVLLIGCFATITFW